MWAAPRIRELRRFALPQPGGERSVRMKNKMADYSWRPAPSREGEAARQEILPTLLEELEEVPESVIDSAAYESRALEMFREPRSAGWCASLLADPNWRSGWSD